MKTSLKVLAGLTSVLVVGIIISIIITSVESFNDEKKEKEELKEHFSGSNSWMWIFGVVLFCIFGALFAFSMASPNFTLN